jgi:hypothetical protein
MVAQISEAISMRFSIRDLMWATLVVAMGLGWWATNTKRLEAVRQAHQLWHTLDAARDLRKAELTALGGDWETSCIPWPNWSILDEPLVEP